MDLSKYNSGDFGFFVRPCISTLWGGEIRWRLEDQKSWMGNISCLRSGNELDIHQPSSNRIFPLLSVCTARIEMKMRMSEEGGGWKFCLIPCHENICRAVLVVRREEGEFEIIVFDIISTLDLTLSLFLKEIYLSRDNVGFHILLKKFAKCKAGWALGRKRFGPKYF